MKFGIYDKSYELIQRYFSTQENILEVRIYGSRAKGTEKTGSDIDLAIYTNSERDLSGKVKTDLEELSTPYYFDITDMKHLTHKALQEHIARVGKLFYKKS